MKGETRSRSVDARFPPRAPEAVVLSRGVSSPSNKLARRRRRRRGAIALMLIFLCGFAYYEGDKRRPVPISVGNTLSGESKHLPRHAPTIRVATFNIHGGVGHDHRVDLARTAEAIKGFDLVLLNEVHGPYFWQSDGQIEQLASLTGNRWLFAPTEERWWHHRFGNGLVTSANVTHWQNIALPGQSRGYRNALLMSLPFGGQTIHILGTHLDRNDSHDRAEQLQAVSSLFLSLAQPAILLGDLNSTADEPIIQSLLQQDRVHDPLHEALGSGGLPHIDWSLTRGLTTVDAGVIDNRASDHPLVWAELKLD